MVGYILMHIEKLEQRPQEAFRLTQSKVKQHANGQGGFNGMARIFLLATTLPLPRLPPRFLPPRQLLLRKPDG